MSDSDLSSLRWRPVLSPQPHPDEQARGEGTTRTPGPRAQDCGCVQPCGSWGLASFNLCRERDVLVPFQM